MIDIYFGADALAALTAFCAREALLPGGRQARAAIGAAEAEGVCRLMKGWLEAGACLAAAGPSRQASGTLGWSTRAAPFNTRAEHRAPGVPASRVSTKPKTAPDEPV